jgi:hypothetical protein
MMAQTRKIEKLSKKQHSNFLNYIRKLNCLPKKKTQQHASNKKRQGLRAGFFNKKDKDKKNEATNTKKVRNLQNINERRYIIVFSSGLICNHITA